MRILLSGLSGTGSTTAAKRIAADFHLDYVYGGQIFRNLARERGISLEDLAESLELDREHHARSAENLLRRGASDNRRYKMLYGIEEAGYASSTRITLPGRMVSRARRTAGTARRTVCKRVSRTITTTTPTSAAATSF